MFGTNQPPRDFLRPVTVTNDALRDHRLAILEPRGFDRFVDSQLMRYNFLVPCDAQTVCAPWMPQLLLETL